MNKLVLELKEMKRAMQSYVFFLYELVLESKPKNVLEIGVRAAQSTRTILSAMNESNFGKLISIDIRDTTIRVPENLKDRWTFILADSTKKTTVDLVNDVFYDIIFIDGSHEYDSIKKDYENYYPLLKTGGFMILHDICNKQCGVPQFWNELNVPNKITFNWGRAAEGVVPGLGIIQK
jgi:predicted O-methyltransferase YrrM